MSDAEVKVEIAKEADATVDLGDRDRRRKRKVGLILGYCGSNYNGSQYTLDKSDDVVGVENVLVDVLVKLGYIDPRNVTPLSKVGWTRSSRTDKGVHSLYTIVSFKMLLTEDEENDILACQGTKGIDGVVEDKLPSVVPRINSGLPEDIHVMAAFKLQNSFNSRRFGEERTYTYVLPLWALAPGIMNDPDTEEDKKGGNGNGNGVYDEAGAVLPTTMEAYNLFKEAMLMFIGTHNMKNFAGKIKEEDHPSGGKFANSNDRTKKNVDENEDGGEGEGESSRKRKEREEDKEAEEAKEEKVEPEPKYAYRTAFPWAIGFKSELLKELSPERLAQYVNFQRNTRYLRTIVDLKVELDTTVPGEGYVNVTLHGNSFVLHQIRKMVGSAIAVGRKMLSIPQLKVALSTPFHMNIFLAPGRPLILDRCYFMATDAAGSFDDYVTPAVEREIEKYRNEVLLPHVRTLCKTATDKVARWVYEGKNKDDLSPEMRRSGGHLQLPMWSTWVTRLAAHDFELVDGESDLLSQIADELIAHKGVYLAEKKMKYGEEDEKKKKERNKNKNKGKRWRGPGSKGRDRK